MKSWLGIKAIEAVLITVFRWSVGRGSRLNRLDLLSKYTTVGVLLWTETIVHFLHLISFDFRKFQ